MGKAHHRSAKASQAWRRQGTIPHRSSSTGTSWGRGRSQGLCPPQQAGAGALSAGGEFIANPTGIFTRLRVAALVSAYPVQLSILNQAQTWSFSKEMLLLIKPPSEEKTILLPLPLQTSPLTLLQLSRDTSCLWTCPS